MGRHARPNTRTLNWAVRKVFTPVLAEIPKPAVPTTNSADHSPEGSGSSTGALISTQVEDAPNVSLVVASVGKKRKRPDTPPADNDEDGVAGDSAETRYKPSNLPPALKKYWLVPIFRHRCNDSHGIRSQRYRLFSRYDEGIQMDYDGWFSVTPENIAAQIAERCRCSVVVDAFCGVGGNAIQFAMTCEKVIAIDNSPIRLACAKANAKIYGVEENIEFVLADYVEWVKSRAQDSSAEPVEVVFLSPPWGGIDYQEADAGDVSDSTIPSPAIPSTYSLSKLAPLHGKDLFDLSARLTKNIAYFLPRNQSLHEVASLVPKSDKVEVEEEWMGNKLKALAVYFGDLVGEQKVID